MTGFEIALLVTLVVCVVASAFFSGSETALVGIARERVHQLAEKSHRGQRLAALVEDTERTLGTLLVANNFVNILGASVATTLTIDLLARVFDRSHAETWGPWVSTLVVTAIVLVVGEITPKTLAARRPDQFALAVAPTIWALGNVLDPVAKVFIAIARLLLRMFGVHARPRAAATEDDIMALAVMSEAAGEIDAAEREILESLFELADRPVRDVMTPRLNVISLEAGSGQVAARQAVARHGHSRFPVVPAGGTLDDVVGVLYAKDLIRNTDEGPIDQFLREPVFVPESTSVLSAIQRLRRQRVSFAVVLDEHGGADGIVTVKDLVAELVGDMQDEYDPREPALYRLGDGNWVVEGRVPVEDVEDAIDGELPEGEYTSIAGLYLWAAGRIPQVGDSVEVGDVKLTVLRMEKRRIERIRLEQVVEPEEATPRTD